MKYLCYNDNNNYTIPASVLSVYKIILHGPEVPQPVSAARHFSIWPLLFKNHSGLCRGKNCAEHRNNGYLTRLSCINTPYIHDNQSVYLWTPACSYCRNGPCIMDKRTVVARYEVEYAIETSWSCMMTEPVFMQEWLIGKEVIRNRIIFRKNMVIYCFIGE